MDLSTIAIAINLKDDASKGIESLGAAFKKLGTAIETYLPIKGLDLGFEAMKSAISSVIGESTQLAARYETLGIVMSNVGNNAGYSAREMDSAASALQKQGISASESRQQLTKLVQANINLADSSKLARVAQDSAVIGNVNSSQAFSQLVQGIQSAQVEMLRTIGINVSFEQGYKKTAQQLGTTVEKLNEQQKMQSRVNQVLEAGTGIAGTYDAAMGTVGKQATSLTRYWDDFRVKLGEAFKPAYSALITGMTESIKSLDKSITDNAASIKTMGAAFGTVIGTTLKIGAATITATASAVSELSGAYKFVSENLSQFVLVLGYLDATAFLASAGKYSLIKDAILLVSGAYTALATAMTTTVIPAIIQMTATLAANPLTGVVIALSAGVAMIGDSAYGAYKAHQNLNQSLANGADQLEGLRRTAARLGLDTKFKDLEGYQLRFNSAVLAGSIVLDEHGKWITAVEQKRIKDALATKKQKEEEEKLTEARRKAKLESREQQIKLEQIALKDLQDQQKKGLDYWEEQLKTASKAYDKNNAAYVTADATYRAAYKLHNDTLKQISSEGYKTILNEHGNMINEMIKKNATIKAPNQEIVDAMKEISGSMQPKVAMSPVDDYWNKIKNIESGIGKAMDIADPKQRIDVLKQFTPEIMKLTSAVQDVDKNGNIFDAVFGDDAKNRALKLLGTINGAVVTAQGQISDAAKQMADEEKNRIANALEMIKTFAEQVKKLDNEIKLLDLTASIKTDDAAFNKALSRIAEIKAAYSDIGAISGGDMTGVIMPDSGYAVGTSFVPRTGLYQLHRGEAVATRAEVSRATQATQTINFSPSINISGGGDLDFNEIARKIVKPLQTEIKKLAYIGG